MVNTVYVKHTS